jgi:lipopolysaccharide transport system ATP-binding protein
MASIDLLNASVEFPIYSSRGRALKHFVLNAATGGKLFSDPKGRVIIKALNNINISLRDGDRLALVGHNGSGKTTLLRVIAGVYRPSSGVITTSGTIGSLIDIFLGTEPEATGLENIYLRAAMMGLSKASTDALVDDIVNFSGLADFIIMPVRTYSSGMSFRLAFAVSTVCRPDIMVMDEWLATGDAGFQQKVEQRLHEVIKASKILVIATHSQELAKRLCNKIVTLDHGTIVCQENL